MVERKEYLAELVGWKDEQVIKVVTGIRRCGKSTLLAQYQDWLRVNGVTDAQIVSVNFEELEYEELLDYKKLSWTVCMSNQMWTSTSQAPMRICSQAILQRF